MDEKLNLSISQRQQTTLAPMQLQLVRMLEMNAAEAEDEVRRALDDNPALEVAEDSHADEPHDEFAETAEQLQMADYRSEEDIPSYRLGVSNRSSDDPVYEPVAIAEGESLYQYLLSQLAEDGTLTPRQMDIARFIVGNMDSNGYMERTVGALVDDLAIQESMDVSQEEVRHVWDIVRSLEPAGVGAVDLRDSLLLQLRRRPETPQIRLATEVIRDYFDLFSLMHFDRIASLTGVSRSQLKEAMDAIRTLHPKPGALVNGDDDERIRHISPDFFVENEGERLSLTMLSRIPHLQIERSFASDTEVGQKKTVAGEAANAFIRQKRDEAATFIKVVTMRNETLYRVMSAIMQWQREFFITGDRLRLRPMVLKDISAVTGDDLSVISRATAGKYVATAQGVYSVKSLFNEHRRDNEATSSEAVLERIRSIVEDEDKANPMSDAEITELLKKEGIDIARRTVAKYRERLGLPVGRLRRKI